MFFFLNKLNWTKYKNDMSMEKSSRFWNVIGKPPQATNHPRNRLDISHHCSRCTRFKTQQEDRGVACLLFKQRLWHNWDSCSWMYHKNSISNHLSWMICKLFSLDTGAEREDHVKFFPAVWFSWICSQSCPSDFQPNFARGKHTTRYIIQTVSLERTLKILSAQNSFMSISS